MRILLDTNVLAAGMAGQVRSSIRPPAQIWRRWRSRQFDLIISAHLLEELQRALSTPWFLERMTEEDRSSLIEELLVQAVYVEAQPLPSKATSHWQDDLVLSAAVSGNADYLVTGDAEFRRVDEYQGVKIRTPAEFLHELDAAQS